MAARADTLSRPVPSALATAALAVFAWAWGCSAPPVATDAPELLKAPANGGTLTVPRGGSFEVELASNRTTGYSWQVDELPGMVAQAGEAVYTASGSESGEALAGAGGVERWRFVADGDPGQGTLLMTYRRPWEKSAPPARTYRLGVTVVPGASGGR